MRTFFQTMQAIFVLLVERAHRVNEKEKENGGKRTVHITKAPGDGDERQVNQIRIKRCAPDRANERLAKNSGKPTLGCRDADDKTAIDKNRNRMMANKIPGDVFGFHREKARIENRQKENLQNSSDIIFFQNIECARFVKPKKNHPEQIFKNAYKGKHVKILITQIVIGKISKKRNVS